MIRFQKITILSFLIIVSSCASLEPVNFQRNPADDKSCAEIVSFFNKQELSEYDQALKLQALKESLRLKNDTREAFEIIKEIKARAEVFYPTSGFKNSDELRLKLQNSSFGAKRAAQILLDEEVEITMAVPEKARDGIFQKGFLNYRETRTSGGVMDSRDEIESVYSGLGSSYWEMRKQRKPKYAYLAPKLDSDLSPPEGLDMYGGDRFIFNLENIKKRMTFTIGGSSRDRMILQDTESLHNYKSQAWDQAYMPWEMRELIAPAIAKGIEDKVFQVQYNKKILSASKDDFTTIYSHLKKNRYKMLEEPTDREMKVNWEDQVGEVILPEDLKEYKTSWGANGNFIEIQIWGRVTLDDVKIFEYGETPPQGEFLKALLDRGIEIRERKK